MSEQQFITSADAGALLQEPAEPERFAVIRDGIVENIIVALPGFEPALGCVLVLDDGTAAIGGTYAAGQFAPPVPVAEDLAAVIKRYDGVVQARIDDVARSFGYGDPNRPQVSPILHAVSYADEPAVPRYQAEAQALRAWRSHTWAAAAALLNAVNAGERAVPTEVEVLEILEQQAPAPVPAPL